LGQEGVRTFNPMPNLDFVSMPLGKYVTSHLRFVQGIKKPPVIFAVNYFLKGSDGKYLTGMDAKRVWIKWMELRVNGDVDGIVQSLLRQRLVRLGLAYFIVRALRGHEDLDVFALVRGHRVELGFGVTDSIGFFLDVGFARHILLASIDIWSFLLVVSTGKRESQGQSQKNRSNSRHGTHSESKFFDTDEPQGFPAESQEGYEPSIMLCRKGSFRHKRNNYSLFGWRRPSFSASAWIWMYPQAVQTFAWMGTTAWSRFQKRVFAGRK